MKDYKATFRFPTHEYAYIEIEAQGSPESLLSQYGEFKRLLEGGEGLAKNDWNRLLDGYIQGGGMNEHMMMNMSKAQAWMIHEIDKSFSRIKARQ